MDDFPVVVMDVDDPLLVIGLAWLAILGMLAWGGAVELWRRVRGRQRVPFFGMLARRDRLPLGPFLWLGWLIAVAACGVVAP